jgi:aconitate hydratase
MVTLIENGVFLYDNKVICENDGLSQNEFNEKLKKAGYAPCNLPTAEEARKGTIASKILAAHDISDDRAQCRIRFDAMASHDITYVGIIQTARASGLEKFPIPYVLTNCHNSLCAVGGTINEDDHVFGLSAAKKYGGIFVPPHQAVIHQYMREMMSGCGKMILGSDSHTRYGALGTMSVGEGGPELVKQLLCNTYDIPAPEIVGVYLTGKPQKGVGPQDVALAIIGAVFKNGFVKNKVLEFVGDGIFNLSVDYRNGIDVMTTETTCLSSIWCTDDKVKDYFSIHGRPEAYKELKPAKIAYYDSMVVVDLSLVRPMIALPFHPSNTYTIEDLCANAGDILREAEIAGNEQLKGQNIEFKLTDKIENGKIRLGQGIIGGCAGGTFENICDTAAIIKNRAVSGNYFSLSVYPASTPIYSQIMKNGSGLSLLSAGAVIKTAFCGPCFGAGDVPANNVLSGRHVTRNFPSREGSKPNMGQIASVALMDARSIAASAVSGGYLTPATDIDYEIPSYDYTFEESIYKNSVYYGFNAPQKGSELKFGPNIADWPEMIELPENLVLKLASVIRDPVTTTDELIPSGETSSYRSNPLRLSEFALSRKDPEYVGRAKEIKKQEDIRREILKGNDGRISDEFGDIVRRVANADPKFYFIQTGIGSVIYANKPGDGSAREQAASCQRVLGGCANIAKEYATKRYRSNLINWGMLPFTLPEGEEFPYETGDYLFIKGIRSAVMNKQEQIKAKVINRTGTHEITLELKNLTDNEREIILKGCLINYYKSKK